MQAPRTEWLRFPAAKGATSTWPGHATSDGQELIVAHGRSAWLHPHGKHQPNLAYSYSSRNCLRLRLTPQPGPSDCTSPTTAPRTRAARMRAVVGECVEMAVDVEQADVAALDGHALALAGPGFLRDMRYA